MTRRSLSNLLLFNLIEARARSRAVKKLGTTHNKS